MISTPRNPGNGPGNRPRGADRAKSFGWLGAAGVLAIAGPACAQAGVGSIGSFGVRANGGALHSVQSTATAGAEAGTVRFIGSAVDPGGAWEASWDYIADLDPNGNAKLNGSATVLNKSAEAAEFDIVFEVPICPFIQSASKMGGSCTIKLTTNANGGAISTQGGHSVFTALADGASGSKLFHGPFNMGSTGSGTAQTGNVFGAPFPASSAAAVNDDFGVRHVFKLTDGDTVLLTSNLVVGGEPGNFVQCQGQAQPQAASSGSPAASPVQAAVVIATGSGPTSSAVTLGASAGGKVTISADKGTKKKPAASKSPKPKAAASPAKPARKPTPTFRQNQPSRSPYRRNEVR